VPFAVSVLKPRTPNFVAAVALNAGILLGARCGFGACSNRPIGSGMVVLSPFKGVDESTFRLYEFHILVGTDLMKKETFCHSETMVCVLISRIVTVRVEEMGSKTCMGWLKIWVVDEMWPMDGSSPVDTVTLASVRVKSVAILNWKAPPFTNHFAPVPVLARSTSVLVVAGVVPGAAVVPSEELIVLAFG
jgi:hypothetical protein